MLSKVSILNKSLNRFIENNLINQNFFRITEEEGIKYFLNNLEYLDSLEDHNVYVGFLIAEWNLFAYKNRCSLIKNLNCIDVAKEFYNKQVIEQMNSLFIDGGHFNKEGSMLVAKKYNEIINAK